MINCIQEALQAGKITKDLAGRLSSYDDINAGIEAETLGLVRQKREAAIQAVRLAEAWDNAKSHEKGRYYGIKALLARDVKEKAGYFNVDILAKTYEHRFQSRFADALSAFRTRKFGLSQDAEGLLKLVKAIYGEAVDDPEIAKFAKQWAELSDEIRAEFNSKGGSISKNEKWNLPQNHDARALESAGLDEWKAFIRNKLDPSQMLDDMGKPLSADDLEAALDYTFETITTHGLNKAKDLSTPRLGKKMARKGSERRFLYFKDADSWIEYNKEFGKGDIFVTMTDHIQSKAHDIAMMEVMGPSPESTFNALKAMAKKEKAFTGSQENTLNALYNTVSGKINGGELVTAAELGQSTRNVLTASTLGAAFLSAISDTGFQLITAKYNKIPFMKVMGEMVSQLNPANEADRIFAGRLGLGLEEWTNLASSANRWSDAYGTGTTAKMADFVMRASFLSQWTGAGRKAFGMEFSAKLADNFGKSLSDLDDGLKRAFKTYGIGEKEWNNFRKSKVLKHRNMSYADLTVKGGEKFHQMVASEMDFAVPTPDANVRMVTTAGIERGSVSGQLVRTLMNLKSFPVSIINSHLYRAFNQASFGDGLQYFGFLFAVTTMMGGLALQAKDIAAGREPRPTGLEDGDMDQFKKYLRASITQGGGLGIIGDYAFSDVNRFGGGPVESAFGPTGELVSKTAKLTLGNIGELIAGEETHIAEEAIQYVKRYTPDVWQTRLFTDAVFDQLTIMADPRYQKKLNRQMKKRYKEYDQKYWWRKGEVLPEIAQ